MALCSAKGNPRLDKLDFELQSLLVSILFSYLRVESFEQKSIDLHFVCSEMMHDPIGVDGEFEPVLTLHGFHEAVGNAVGHNELEVLALVVVLEVVVVLIRRHKAVVGLGSNICKERKVELMVVNLRIGSQTPV